MPRYIDADKLLMQFNDWALSVSPDERHEGTERLIRQTAYETIRSAIESITEQPDLQPTCNQLATDCISRQVAIDLLKRWSGGYSYIEYDTESAIYEFERLPSAHPYTEAEIQKMQDLEQAEIEKAFEFGKAEANRWISCSERLPEDDSLMLVNYIEPREEGMDIWIGWHEMENVWYINGEAHSREFENEVLAWQPLPDPYQPERSEE